MTVFMGTDQIMKHFGGVTQANLNVMTQVATRFEKIPIATFEETVRVANKHEADEKAKQEREQAKKDAEDRIKELGGPFSYVHPLHPHLIVSDG